MNKSITQILTIATLAIFTSCTEIDLQAQLERPVLNCGQIGSSSDGVTFENSGNGDSSLGKCMQYDKNLDEPNVYHLLPNYIFTYTPNSPYISGIEKCRFTQSISSAIETTANTYEMTMDYSNPESPSCSSRLVSSVSSGGAPGGGAGGAPAATF